MDEVRKLDGILNKEDRNVVSDEIPIPLLRVELDSETSDVAGRVDRAGASGYRRDSREQGRLYAHLAQDLGACVFRQRLLELEESVRARSTRVHNPLGNALMIEVVDFLAEDKVF
jgi:hypothetical protein